jgi:hypothetical protein
MGLGEMGITAEADGFIQINAEHGIGRFEMAQRV